VEHWFDRATKFLAAGSVSRRQVMETAAITGAVAALPTTASARALGGLIEGAHTLAAASACEKRRKPGVSTMSASDGGVYRGQRLTLSSTWKKIGNRHAQITFSQSAELGGKLIYQVTVQAAFGFRKDAKRGARGVPVVHADISYGPEVRGPRHIVLQSVNGTVSGQADGRKFADKQHPPKISIESGLRRTLTELTSRQREDLRHCRSASHVQRARRVSPVTRSQFLAPQASRNGAAALEARDTVAQSSTSSACQDCINGCDTTVAAGLGIAVFGLAFGDPVQALGGLITSFLGGESCMGNCSQAGGPCCSVQCYGGAYCCANGQQCCSQNASCCDDSSICISNTAWGVLSQCCPSDYNSNGCLVSYGNGIYVLYCLESGGQCCGTGPPCPTGMICGGYEGSCCKTGQTICAGGCCTGECANLPGYTQYTYSVGNQTYFGGIAPNQACCSKEYLCGSACCDPKSTWTPGAKCLKTSSHKPICCPPPYIVCGSTCCAQGQSCYNGKCHFGQPCGNAFCGFASCCRGKCCKPGQACILGRCVTLPPSKTKCPSGQIWYDGKCYPAAQ